MNEAIVDDVGMECRHRSGLVADEMGPSLSRGAQRVSFRSLHNSFTMGKKKSPPDTRGLLNSCMNSSAGYLKKVSVQPRQVQGQRPRYL